MQLLDPSENQDMPTPEEVFLAFLKSVVAATTLVEVNIAAGIAWQALQNLGG